MRFIIRARNAVLALIILTSCNYTKIKNPGDGDNSTFKLPDEKLSELSYGLLAQKVFLPKCISCHGNAGGINLESYPEVVKHLAEIKSSVFDKRTMPKRGSLTLEEMAYLWNWIQMGAPETAQGGKPPVPEERILPTFESIDRHVLQTSCKDCHNPQDSGKRIPLDIDSLRSSPLELIIPGNPDESGLVIAVERGDDKRMPPTKEGYSEISKSAKEAIRKWIENGAAD